MGPGSSRPRLADVAARAGVSRTTASYIVNGRSSQMRISDDAVRRVTLAVSELGYRPNLAARSLRTAETRTVGLVSDHVASGHFAGRMITGASAAARALDHLMVIGESDGDPLLEQRIVEQMLDQGVDGIVYASLRHREVTPPPQLHVERTVLLNCVPARGAGAGAGGHLAIVPDERGGGRRAGDLLGDALTGPDATTGVGEVAVLGDEREEGTLAGRLRLEGLRARLGEVGGEVSMLLRCAWGVAAGREAIATWWAAGGRARGLVCMNDRLALGAYQALGALGVRVPDDLAVVSFDGSQLATWLDPALTSVALPFDELGAHAVRALLDPGAGSARLGSGEVVRVEMPVLRGASLGRTRQR